MFINNNCSFKVTVKPVTEPITLSEAKVFLKVDSSDDDTLITSLISSVRVAAENHMGSSLITRTMELYMDKFPVDNYILLPRSPIVTVTSIQYIDASGSSNTYDSSNYITDGLTGKITLATGSLWPMALRSANAVTIVYVAGYGATSTDIPSDILSALKSHIAYLYTSRGEDSNIPSQSLKIYNSYKTYSVDKVYG